MQMSNDEDRDISVESRISRYVMSKYGEQHI